MNNNWTQQQGLLAEENCITQNDEPEQQQGEGGTSRGVILIPTESSEPLLESELLSAGYQKWDMLKNAQTLYT